LIKPEGYDDKAYTDEKGYPFFYPVQHGEIPGITKKTER
jgi:hypothetical protein